MNSIMIPYLQGFDKSHFVPIKWVKSLGDKKIFTWYDLLFTVQIIYTKNNVNVSIHDNYFHFITNNTFTTIKSAVSFIDYELSFTFNEMLLKNCCVGDLHEFTLFELLRDNDKLSEFDSLCF